MNEKGWPSFIEMADANQHDDYSVLPASWELTTTESQPESEIGFESALLENLARVNRLQGETDQHVQRLHAGDSKNVADVLSAVDKAEVAYHLLMEIRGQLTEAYREIRRMQG